MSDDVSAEIIKNTQKALGKYVKKPQLTEKLLKKPPFKFLHDVITTVIKETGFLKGLYNEVEMQSDNVKEKDMKIAYLTKLIEAVSKCITLLLTLCIHIIFLKSYYFIRSYITTYIYFYIVLV